ncbi:MAG: DUF5615 family PIN-like protein [Chloroflexi bacterium]|nr:DUF5615 family PIN-like protein [Chloroflexota bacterium]
MKYYLDELASTEIARAGRLAGLDIVSSHEAGRDGTSDEVQLLFAAAEGRCFVTQNYRDLRRLTVAFHERNLPHFGVLFLPRGAVTRHLVGLIVEALKLHDQQHPAGVAAYSESFLKL